MGKSIKPGDRLAKWISDNGKKKEHVASELGVARQTLRYWLRGERVPRTDIAVKIEKLAGIKPSEWIS